MNSPLPISKHKHGTLLLRLKHILKLYTKKKDTLTHQQFYWETCSIKGIPLHLAEQLETEGIEQADCKLIVNSRMKLKGEYGPMWLVITQNEIMTLTENHSQFQVEKKIQIRDLNEVHVTHFPGGGMLRMQAKGVYQNIIRFDMKHAQIFGLVANILQKYIDESSKTGEPLNFSELLTNQRKQVCQTCKRDLPTHSQVCPFCLKKSLVLFRILNFAGPYVRQIVILMIIMVSGILLSLLPPQIMKVLVDDVLSVPGNHGKLVLSVAMLAIVLIGNHLLHIVQGRLAVKVGGYITTSIRLQTYQHLQSLSLSFFNKQETGSLMARISQNVNQMEGFLVEGIQFTIVNLLMIVFIVVIMIWMNPLLGLLVIVPMPFVIILSKIFWKNIHLRFAAFFRSMSAFSSQLNDTLSGIRVIKAFGQEPQEIARFQISAVQFRERMMDAENSWQTLVPILNLIIQSSLLLIWYFGALTVWNDESFTIGTLLAYVGYLGMIYGPLQLVTRLNDWMSRAMAAGAQVFEILDTTSEIRDSPNAVSLESIEGNIEFKNVVFGYEKHNPVLKNVSLHLEKNKMYGLVGHSGAGKSTIINLLGRLYDIDSGQILIDGVDLRDIKIQDLRKQVGFVLQDTFLFKNTVAKNIAYARIDANEEEIINAAVMANAHEFIMNLPDGYDTILGERGINLSGGEKQRISIARAILHNPKILILDEATSSVDTETEAKIQQALFHLTKGRTTIAIAHRLSTLRNADMLIVLKDGKIAEQGSHEQLMKIESGIYRKLVDIQSEWSKSIGIGGG